MINLCCPICVVNLCDQCFDKIGCQLKEKKSLRHKFLTESINHRKIIETFYLISHIIFPFLSKIPKFPTFYHTIKSRAVRSKSAVFDRIDLTTSVNTHHQDTKLRLEFLKNWFFFIKSHDSWPISRGDITQ